MNTLLKLPEHIWTERTLQQCRWLLDAVPDALVIVRRGGTIAQVNSKTETLFGHTRQELLGQPVEILLPVRFRDQHPAQRDRCFANPRVRPMGTERQLYGQRKDGSEFPVDISLSPLETAEGLLIVGAIRDLSAGHATQAQLQKAEARYRALVEEIPAVTFVAALDEGGNELYVSPQIEALLGFSQKEWLEDPVLWYRQLHADDRERWHVDFAQTCATGQRFCAEYRFLARNGNLVWVHGEAKLVLDNAGRPLFLQGVAFDITERKRAEEAMRQVQADLKSRVQERTAALLEANEALAREAADRRSAEEGQRAWRERYEAAVKATGQLLYDRDLQTGDVTYGGNFEGILGCSPADMGRNSWRQLVHAEDLGAFDQEVERSLRTQQSFRLEYRVRRQDGGYIHVNDRGYFLLDTAGHVARMVGLVSDITRERVMEAQLRQAQKMEAVGRLAGGVAHEINNMMTIVSGYGEILLRKLPVTDSSRGAAEQIKRAGDRAAEIARQLLAFSRKQVLTLVVLDLNAVVANVAKMLRAVVGEEVEMVTDLQRGLWPVRVDPGQMEQVLVNLAANARDAMPGGGKLTIRTANLTRTATAGQQCGPGPDSYVTLSVSDTGCGIDEQTRKHLFEPFFTTKDVGKGTGLGLATVHGIVMQSSGSITVESVPGCGSTFHIHLPPSQKPVPSKKRPSGTRRIPQGVATVLLVEDEKDVRGLAHLALETAGYRVLDAENGEEALRVVSQSAAPFHLLVTDVIMPRMNGKQLAERLVARQPDLRVLFLSGYSADVLNQKSLLGEGAAFLQKPYTPTTLVQKVHALLDSNRVFP